MIEQNRRPLRYTIPTFTQIALTVVEYAWAVVVVLNGNSVYHASAFKEYHLLELSLFLTLLLLLMVMYVYRIRPVWDQLLVAVGAMIYAVIYLSVKQSQMAVTNYLYLLVGGLPSLLLLFSILHSRGMLLQLLRKLFNVVFVLALVSLYYWLFGVTLKLIPPNCSISIKWGVLRQVVGYNGIHYVIQADTTFLPDQWVYRNSSLFAEAPMFNLWLDIALAGELFLKPRASKGRVAVLAVTVLTTMSVTGIMFLALCVVLHVCLNYREMERRQKMLVLAAGFFLLPVALGSMFSVLILKSDTESYAMRLGDYVAGVRLWMDHPLFGSGYGDLAPLMKYAYSPNGVIGFSNSLTAVLGTGGLWMALVFYVPHLAMLFPRNTGDKKLVCFGVCDLFLFCTTLYYARYIGTVLIVFSTVVVYQNWKKKH